MAEKIYMVKESEMKSVSKSINDKNQTNKPLRFPDEWISNINNIETGVPVPLANCTGISCINIDGTKAALKWTDPNDSIYNQNGQSYNISTWNSTIVRAKEGSYPSNEADGRLIIDSKVRNQYASKHIVIDNLLPGNPVNIKLFPKNTKGLVTNNTANQVQVTPQLIPIGNLKAKRVVNPKTGNSLELTWTDPDNIIKSIDGVSYTTSEWAKTIVRISETTYPTSPTDGTAVVTETQKNKYASVPLTITGLTEGKTYYISLFPVAKNGLVNSNAENRVTENTKVNSPILTVKFSGSNPVGTRMDAAAGFVVQIANSTSQVVRNDYDNVFPYNYMKQHMNESNNGRIITRIPRFARKINSDYGMISICDSIIDSSWEWDPVFVRADGSLRDYYDHGDYHTSGSNSCTNGQSPVVSQRRSWYRDQARAIGNGWIDIDIEAWECYWTLFLVQHANRNSDAVMSGNTSGSKVNTGATFGAKSTNVQISNTHQSFYGIENEYSNLYTFIDGINFNSSTIYTCKDITKYADDTSSNYTNVGTRPTSDGWITSMKKLSNGLIYADSVSGGSSTTYWCDYHYQNTGWRILRGGRDWDANDYNGLFCLYGNIVSSRAYSGNGSRLIYKP